MRDVMERSKAIEPEPTLPPPPRGMTLYQLEDALYQAHEAVSDALEAGVDPPAAALATINEYALAAADKRDACGAVLRRLDAEMDYGRAEIQRLTRLVAARENAAARLRGMILAIMQQHQVTKIKGNTTTFTVVQSPPHVEVDENADLPPELRRVIPERWEPDKVKIREELKAGNEVPGARLVPGSFRLVVR